MKQNEEAFHKYLKLIHDGKYLQVIDLFYAENIRQVENTEPPIIGKQKLRQAEVNNLAKVSHVKIRTSKELFSIEDNFAWGEMTIVFESNNQSKVLTESFYQEWKDGLIALQRFYYDEIKIRAATDDISNGQN